MGEGDGRDKGRGNVKMIATLEVVKRLTVIKANDTKDFGIAGYLHIHITPSRY